MKKLISTVLVNVRDVVLVMIDYQITSPYLVYDAVITTEIINQSR